MQVRGGQRRRVIGSSRYLSDSAPVRYGAVQLVVLILRKVSMTSSALKSAEPYGFCAERPGPTPVAYGGEISPPDRRNSVGKTSFVRDLRSAYVFPHLVNERWSGVVEKPGGLPRM